MAVIEAGAAVIGAVKAAADIVRDVRKSNDPTVLKAAINTLTAHLADALSGALDLQVEIATLDAKCRALEAANGKKGGFAEKAQRYVRQQSRGGAFVYVEKDLAGGNGGSPNFCAHCFENEKISVLQYLGVLGQSKCPTCGGQCKTG
jgi:hypothetical protein